MIYLTSYKEGERIFCCVKFQSEDFEVEGYGSSFWRTLLFCLFKGFLLKIKLKTKKLITQWKGH
ncbi:hypothetical protein JGI1_00277 [Candidatus Thermokryptus mobilis]|uniref:Uncharacterized protein n=1 Tax=Candidatus Thermokryptus mobilis TaxID=1643428 RepID=A0A0S4MS64_9BACT|nr:hypothetical protein JGI1_00277 [Candidatus Thermokryptus mobilis]